MINKPISSFHENIHSLNGFWNDVLSAVYGTVYSPKQMDQF